MVKKMVYVLVGKLIDVPDDGDSTELHEFYDLPIGSCALTEPKMSDPNSAVLTKPVPMVRCG